LHGHAYWQAILEAAGAREAMDQQPAIVPAPDWRPHRENTMSDSTEKKNDDVPEPAKLVQEHEDEPMEDEEKILIGRHDVNYPAMLTKDVPGG
jgi:hypothetical protein